MMVNQQMVEAHKKMVESKLQMEVAHSVTNCYSDCHGCSNHSLAQEPVEAGEAGEAGAVARLCLARNVKNGSKRFFPHLEQIPEESRHSTFKNSGKKQDGGNFSLVARSLADGCSGSEFSESSDGSISTSDLEYKEESSTNKSNPRSMDSGIATRLVFAETLPKMRILFILDPQVLLQNMEVITTLRQQAVKVNIKIFLWTSQIFFTPQIFSL